MWGIALVFKGFSVGGERELRTAMEPQYRVKKTKNRRVDSTSRGFKLEKEMLSQNFIQGVNVHTNTHTHTILQTIFWHRT